MSFLFECCFIVIRILHVRSTLPCRIFKCRTRQCWLLVRQVCRACASCLTAVLCPLVLRTENVTCQISKERVLGTSNRPPLSHPGLCTLRGCRVEKNGMLASLSEGAFQRHAFSEPDSRSFRRRRKCWIHWLEMSALFFFPLINTSLLMFWLPVFV